MHHNPAEPVSVGTGLQSSEQDKVIFEDGVVVRDGNTVFNVRHPGGGTVVVIDRAFIGDSGELSDIEPAWLMLEPSSAAALASAIVGRGCSSEAALGRVAAGVEDFGLAPGVERLRLPPGA